MTQVELARKVLDDIGWHSLHCSLYASEGGACGGGWDGDDELELSPEQICCLLKERMGNEELFEGIATEEIDIDEEIGSMAEAGSWPEGGPHATVNDAIPDELAGLSEELDALAEGENDADSIKDIREKLRAIKDGNYTFHFTVVDAEDSYYFDENAEEEVPLTAMEAIGLLYGQYDLDEVFEGICDQALDEDFINDKAEEMGLANGYDDSFSYGGECGGLDGFLDAWVFILENILSGDITEQTLDSWTEYFDDPENYETDISDWHADRE